MTETNEAVDIPAKATPFAPGEPVKAKAITQMGGTFAERAGKKAPPLSKVANTTFADRAKAVKPAEDDVEDKAVGSAKSRRPAAKK